MCSEIREVYDYSDDTDSCTVLLDFKTFMHFSARFAVNNGIFGTNGGAWPLIARACALVCGYTTEWF